MNTQLFGQLLTDLQFVGRNPSWLEYEIGSPAERRAILARWQEIRDQPILREADWSEWTKAAARLGRAHDLTKAPSKEPEQESAQSRFLRGEIPGADTNEDQGL